MKIKNIISVLSALFVTVSALTHSFVSVSAEQYQNQKDEVVMLVNEQRTANGKAILYESALLNQAAQVRAEELISSFSHTRPDGRKSFTAFTDLGGTYMAIGENIAFGYPTEADVMNGWMNSE